jgi:hypothetical protein
VATGQVVNDNRFGLTPNLDRTAAEGPPSNTAIHGGALEAGADG